MRLAIIKVRFFLSLFFLLSGLNFAFASEADYFPLSVGNTWVYKINSEPGFILKVVGKEKVSGLDCFVIEAYKGDRLSYREHRAKVKDKDLGVKILCAAADKTFEFSPRVLLKSGLKASLNWSGESKVSWQRNSEKGELEYSIEARVVSREIIKVPAGEFSCYKIEINETNDDVKFTSFWWYSNGVGWVKKQYLSSGVTGEEIYELERYRVKR